MKVLFFFDCASEANNGDTKVFLLLHMFSLQWFVPKFQGLSITALHILHEFCFYLKY